MCSVDWGEGDPDCQGHVMKGGMLTPIFSRERARTSAPFFWLTNMIIGGSMLLLKRESSFFLLSASDTMNTCCSTFSVGLPVGAG